MRACLPATTGVPWDASSRPFVRSTASRRHASRWPGSADRKTSTEAARAQAPLLPHSARATRFDHRAFGRRGVSMPTASQTVGKKSTPLMGTSQTEPGAILPGQRKSPGTRCPPSQTCDFLASQITLRKCIERTVVGRQKDQRVVAHARGRPVHPTTDRPRDPRSRCSRSIRRASFSVSEIVF